LRTANAIGLTIPLSLLLAQAGVIGLIAVEREAVKRQCRAMRFEVRTSP
jgi:hypothetical protein